MSTLRIRGFREQKWLFWNYLPFLIWMSFLEPLLSWFSQRSLNPLLGWDRNVGATYRLFSRSHADISKQTLNTQGENNAYQTKKVKFADKSRTGKVLWSFHFQNHNFDNCDSHGRANSDRPCILQEITFPGHIHTRLKRLKQRLKK